MPAWGLKTPSLSGLYDRLRTPRPYGRGGYSYATGRKPKGYSASLREGFQLPDHHTKRGSYEESFTTINTFSFASMRHAYGRQLARSHGEHHARWRKLRTQPAR